MKLLRGFEVMKRNFCFFADTYRIVGVSFAAVGSLHFAAKAKRLFSIHTVAVWHLLP